jgi:hypothetical protein
VIPPYTMPLFNSGSSAQTLILTNYSRLAATYDEGLAGQVMSNLNAFASRSDIQGTVIAIDLDPAVAEAYDNWNADYCIIQQANDVAEAVKELISTYLTDDVKYFVFVGSDEIIPFYRVPDEVKIANEQWFAEYSQTNNSPTFWALASGHILTDDFYTDELPLLWKGRELFVPDRASGRLVETPGQINSTIDNYIATQNVDINKCLVTGYDFLTDSANAIDQTLRTFDLIPEPLINDTWDANDLIDRWTGLPGDEALDLVSINAHFEHWRAGPASSTAGDFVNADVNNVEDQIAYSMGCHSGLNVPDSAATGGSPDFPQVFAENDAAAWIANTGYGYGMDDAITHSELLYLYLTQELGATAEVPIGQALIQAKQRYLGSAAASGFGLYDEKIMIESTLYGLPMVTASVPSPQTVEETVGVFPTIGDPDPDGDVQIVPVSLEFDATLHVTDPYTGEYYSFGGEVQASPGRPIQPRASIPLFSIEGDYEPRGVVFVSTSFSEITDFNPVISRPVWYDSEDEPEFDAEGWFPAKFWILNRFGDQDRLVVVGGQFNNEGLTERLFNNMSLEVIYGPTDTDDFSPPGVDFIRVNEIPGALEFKVDASDESGVARVFVTYNLPDSNNWESQELTYNSTLELWTGAIPGMDIFTDYFIQACDTVGNCSFKASKNDFLAGNPPNPFTNAAGEPHTFVITVWKDDGNGFVLADGEYPDVNLKDENGNPVTAPVDTCDSDGTGHANPEDYPNLGPGQCQVTFTYFGEGAVRASAQVTVGLLGLNIEQNANAVKTYVRGSLRWNKVNLAEQPIGGATFEVCRTHDAGDTDPLVEPVCMLIEDNTGVIGYIGTDEDINPGGFRVTNLVFGTYEIRETSAPTGYSGDDARVDVVDLTFSERDVIIQQPWVNTSAKLAPTQTTCQDFIDGTAQDITEIFYGKKGKIINNTNPGVFFYYTKFTGPSDDFIVNVIQESNHDFKLFSVQNEIQVRVFNSDCTTPPTASVTILELNGNTSLLIQDGAGQELILSVKYDTAAVVGEEIPKLVDEFHYEFWTEIDGLGVVDFDLGGLDLVPK